MNSNQIIANFQNCKSIADATQWEAVFSRYGYPDADIAAWDTETTGLDRHARVFGISIAFSWQECYYTAWARKGTKLYDILVAFLQTVPVLVAHGARFDIRMMSYDGLDLSHTDCTYTMSRIYYDRRNLHSLKIITEFLCPELSQWDDVIQDTLRKIARATGRKKDEVSYEEIPDETISPYAQLDSFMCLMVYYHLWPHIRSIYQEVYAREKKIYNLIRKVEAQGLHYSWRKSLREAKPIQAKAATCLAVCQQLAISDKPFTYWKDVLNALLFLGIPKKLLTVKGKVTTEADNLRYNLEKFPPKAKKFVTNLLDMRSYNKITGTYLLPFAAQARANDGYVYCEINPTDTVTGRMASRNPNLMNVPEPIARKTAMANPVRECFTCAPDEAIYYFDNEQMEMAYFGLLANDTDMVDGYHAGQDIHMVMAKIMYGEDCTKRERDITKNINFGIIYGMGIRLMAKLYGFTLKEAKDFIAIYYRRFPTIKEFQDRCDSDIRQCGYVSGLFGKRYHVQEAYKAVNALVQGGCAQAFKEQMLAVNTHLFAKDAILPRNYLAEIIMPVHDEIQIRTHRMLIHTNNLERLFCRSIIDVMSEIPQLIERGLRLRIKCERTVTSWSRKKELPL